MGGGGGKEAATRDDLCCLACALTPILHLLIIPQPHFNNTPESVTLCTLSHCAHTVYTATLCNSVHHCHPVHRFPCTRCTHCAKKQSQRARPVNETTAEKVSHLFSWPLHEKDSSAVISQPPQAVIARGSGKHITHIAFWQDLSWTMWLVCLLAVTFVNSATVLMFPLAV